MWCIEWDGDGGVTLVSPFQPHLWQPMKPARATCHVHFGRQVPNVGCTCGLYAVSSLERLPTATGLGSSLGVGVVGSVAMWGRVVEHAQGFRAQLAYPARLRLICQRCFAAGRDGVPTLVERHLAGRAEPVCDAHASSDGSSREAISPDDLQQLLLSTYAVDLLPAQTLHEAGYLPGPASVPGLLPAVRLEIHQLTHTSAGGSAIALLIIAFLVLRALGLFSAPPGIPEQGPAPVGAGIAGYPGATGGTPSELARPEREHAVRFAFGFVCGHRTGMSVELMDCGRRRADLLGSYSSPPESRRACAFGTAYSRKPNFSMCWFELGEEPGPPLDLLRLPGLHLAELPT